MLSINSYSTNNNHIKTENTMTFRRKPKTKEIQQTYKSLEDSVYERIMKNPKVSSRIKKQIAMDRAKENYSQMSLLEKIKFLIKKTL